MKSEEVIRAISGKIVVLSDPRPGRLTYRRKSWQLHELQSSSHNALTERIVRVIDRNLNVVLRGMRGSGGYKWSLTKRNLNRNPDPYYKIKHWWLFRPFPFLLLEILPGRLSGDSLHILTSARKYLRSESPPSEHVLPLDSLVLSLILLRESKGSGQNNDCHIISLAPVES